MKYLKPAPEVIMNSLSEIWSTVKERIAKESGMSDASYSLWIKELELAQLTDESAYIITSRNFRMPILSTRYKTTVEKYLAEVIGFDVQAVFISTEGIEQPVEKIIADHMEHGGIPKGAVSSIRILSEKSDAEEKTDRREKDEEKSVSDIRRPFADTPKTAEAAEPVQTLSDDADKDVPYAVTGNMTYNDEYTFDNFIVGNTNKYAHAACLAVTNNPSKLYNPLFIYGESGLGKTHLLYAITNQILKTKKAKNVLYVRGEDFTNQMITSLMQKKPMLYFREKYRKVDVLLVDDIQFIAGKEAIQEEFFHTFNALYDEKKQIILTSDRPPKDIQTLEDRLKSRFEWGLIVDIQPPDLELRIAILKRKSDSMGINVPDDVIIYLAEQIKSNIRQLEGAIKKLSAYSVLNNTPIDIRFAKECIKDIVKGTEPISVTVDKVFLTVSKHYGVPVEEIKSKKRNKEISQARHAAVYLLRKTTDLSLNDIGKLFDQHHTTILSAITNMEEEMRAAPSTEHEITELMKEIK